MKNLKSLSVVLLFLTSFNSCETEDPFTLIPITDNFASELTIDIPLSTNASQLVSETSIIDLTTNQEISDNAFRVVDARVNALSYKVTNFSGAPGLILSNASLIIAGTQITIEDINLQEASSNNTEFHINDIYFLNRIASVFKHTTTATALVTGQLNDAPAIFSISINLNLTVGLDPL